MPLPCRVYIHDPGAYSNVEAMKIEGERWSQLDHSWHVAYWLHRTLENNFVGRVKTPAEADVIFVAHYFLHHNPSDNPLFFGAPLNQWNERLTAGGTEALLNNDSRLLRRWAQHPDDFVVAPLLIACKNVPYWLRKARFILLDQFFGNACDYRLGDIVAPYVPSDRWRLTEPPPQAAASVINGAPRRHFLLYAGRLSKVYIDYPRSLLRYRLWTGLRRHPNVTFWATDVSTSVAPYLSLPGERCAKCGYSCKYCLDGLAPGANLSVGSVQRLAPARYRELMGNATYCLVPRGDTPSTRKLSEAVLAGCVPILIADMPSWPFDRRLNYSSFAYEFDYRAAILHPLSVVDFLLRVSPAELAAKRVALANAASSFVYHTDTHTAGATAELIADMCNHTHRRRRARRSLDEVYAARPMLGRELLPHGAVDVTLRSPDVANEEGSAPSALVSASKDLQWSDGYCAITHDVEAAGRPIDCERDAMGSWALPGSVQARGWPAVAKACEARCARCPRCRYMSASVEWADCSWFWECPPTTALNQSPSGFKTAAMPTRVGTQGQSNPIHGTGRNKGRSAERRPNVAESSPKGSRFTRVGDGFCAKTMAGLRGDCEELGSKGSFELAKPQSIWANRGAAFDECTRLCLACGRCRFVSFSVRHRDCSWFHSCSAPLNSQVGGFVTFRLKGERRNTSAARRGGARPPSPPLRVRRDALRIVGTGNAPRSWEWLAPPAKAHVAIVLFGKVGTLDQSSSTSGRDSGDGDVVRLSAASLKAFVVRANPDSLIDLFVHSWNPRLGALLDALHAPKWSAHENEQGGIDKVASASASLKAALAARRRHESQAGVKYDLVLAIRHDLVWYKPLVWASLPRAQLWLPAQCCRPDPGRYGEVPDALEGALAAMRRECLGNEDGIVNAVCSTSRFLRMAGGDTRMPREAEFNYYVNDWLFLAPSATADSFAAISERRRAYDDALDEVGIRVAWLHFFWAAHVHHALGVSEGVRPAIEAGTEFNLVRLAASSRFCKTSALVANASVLPAVRPPVWGNMANALCPRVGTVSCHWTSQRCAAGMAASEMSSLFA